MLADAVHVKAKVAGGVVGRMGGAVLKRMEGRNLIFEDDGQCVRYEGMQGKRI